MNISIPPVVIGLVIIVIGNFLVSFGESNLMKKGYILVSTILAAMGISGIIILRPMLASKLNKGLSNGRLDTEFVSWAITKFDFFAVISIIVTCLAVIVLVCMLIKSRKNRDSVVWNNISGFVNALRLINFLVMILYSYGTINKRFDLASYIAMLSFSEIFTLYIPLITKRIIMLKR